jgi:hypothetical protein
MNQVYIYAIHRFYFRTPKTRIGSEGYVLCGSMVYSSFFSRATRISLENLVYLLLSIVITAVPRGSSQSVYCMRFRTKIRYCTPKTPAKIASLTYSNSSIAFGDLRLGGCLRLQASRSRNFRGGFWGYFDGRSDMKRACFPRPGTSTVVWHTVRVYQHKPKNGIFP